MKKNKSFTSKQAYDILYWGLIWVVILYDIIQYYIGFSYIDELFAAWMVILSAIYCRNINYKREFFVCLGIFLFYFIYSWYWGENVREAVWMDFLIQLKPYLVFYSACLMNLKLDEYYKRKLNSKCKWLAIFMIPFGILTQFGVITTDAGGPRFTSMVTFIGLLYLYSSRRKRKNVYWTFVIWTIAFIPMKAKFFGFYALAVFLMFVLKNERIKINLKYLVMGIVGLFFIYIVAYDKIQFYFMNGSESEIMFARPALFYGALEILKSYFPFGSGLGSYASFASAEYFSNLYWKMDITRFSELSEGNFLCDTFFPSLAQFGIVGIFFFVLFWKYRIHEFNECYSIDNVYIYKCLYLIFGYFMIESMADSSYVQNRGLFMFLVMAMFINELKTKQDIIIKNKVC